jgi:hypothetical protein
MHCVLYCAAVLCAQVDGRYKDTFYHSDVFETRYLIEGQPDSEYKDGCIYGHWGSGNPNNFTGIAEVLTRLETPELYEKHNLCNSASTYSSHKEFYAMIALVAFNVVSAGYLWYSVRQWHKRCESNKSE